MPTTTPPKPNPPPKKTTTTRILHSPSSTTTTTSCYSIESLHSSIINANSPSVSSTRPSSKRSYYYDDDEYEDDEDEYDQGYYSKVKRVDKTNNRVIINPTSSPNNPTALATLCICVCLVLIVLGLVWVVAISNGGSEIPRSSSNNRKPQEPPVNNSHIKQHIPTKPSRHSPTSSSSSSNIVSEYIHLYKLPPPLDNDDLSETHRNADTKHHYYNTGVFRPTNSKLWDPHPQYIFQAFGKRFHIVLNQIPKVHSFLVPGFKVTTHGGGGDGDESWVRRGGGEKKHDDDQVYEGCFYNGYVLGDLGSSVAVSLCSGMTGHIRTSTGSYFIEPRRYNNDLEHEIYQIVPTQRHDDTVTDHVSKTQSSRSHLHHHHHSTTSSPHYHPDNNHHHDDHKRKHTSKNTLPTTVAPTTTLEPGSHGNHNRELKITSYDYYSDEDYDSNEYSNEYDEDEEDFVEDEEEEYFKSDHHATRSKRSLSTERYVELTVVTDQTMSDYHGDNLKHYVLTLLSIVALVYRDASIGNPVNIVLVNFHVLTDTDFSTHQQLSSNNNSSSSSSATTHGTSASEMLRNFCKWQKDHNHPDDRHALHHDTALLLTRETICRNPWVGKCDTLGLAELGTMCDHYASCAIVQDNGLSAAFTIAHELGHVMNMPHDDDYKCQGFVKGGEVGGSSSDEEAGGSSLVKVQHFVMSRMLDHNTYPWAWSTCSRHFLTEFLDAGHGYCLEDKPQSNMLVTDDGGENSVDDSSNSGFPGNSTGSQQQQPGEIFSEHKQCELVFGPNSKLCSYMPPCRRLWCTNHGPESEESEGCRTQHMPWADGTRCGANKWCQRGACVLKDLEKLRVVNGGWGVWQDYGECSRACGGGVRKSYRECDDPKPRNGGKYCVGPRVRYESCNTFECSSSSSSSRGDSDGGVSGVDFRGVQCGDYNGDNFNIHGLPEDVVWVPKYNGISPKDRCKLFCRVQGSSSYYLLKEKVIDGTPCGIDTFDICVNGACLPGGCDRKLHSTKALDVCGICGGDSSTCTTTQGTYNTSKYGYNTILTIPSGASNIDIRQRSYDNTARDDNYLALYDPTTSEYILNGHFVVSMFRKSVHYGGSVLEYSGSDQIVERINSSSRVIRKSLEVRVLSVGKLNPPDISYQYVRSDVVDHEVESSSIVVSGSTQDVSYEWVGLRAQSEATCTTVCSGVTTPYKTFECVRKTAVERVTVPPDYCNHVSKPTHNPTPCNTHCTLSYRLTCPENCANARNHTVECIRTLTASNATQGVSNQYCKNSGVEKGEGPDCISECRDRKAKWRVTQWSECRGESSSSSSSGGVCNGTVGIMIRKVWCQKFNWRSLVDDRADVFVQVDDRECGGWEGKPVGRKSCKVLGGGSGIGVVCGVWSIDQWSPCSKTCGPGRRRALYACVLPNSKTDILPSNYCTHVPKPVTEEPCETVPCASYVTSEWSTCDCTNKVEYRNVSCKVNGEDLDDTSACERILLREPKPEDSRACACSSSTWNVTEWSSDCRLYNGKYYRYRVVTCGHASGCGGSTPESKLECGVWRVESGWGGCNGTCELGGSNGVRGAGVEVRVVNCYVRGVKSLDSDCVGVVGGRVERVRNCFRSCGGSSSSSSGVKSLRMGGKGEEGFGGGVNNSSYFFYNTHNARESYRWEVSGWGKCTRMTTQKTSSSSCTTIIITRSSTPSSSSSPPRLFRKHRQVKCIVVPEPTSTRVPTTVPTAYCNDTPKPATSTNCTEAELEELEGCGVWVVSSWGACNVSGDCGGLLEYEMGSSSVVVRGVRSRGVECVEDTSNRVVGDSVCSGIPKPEGSEDCVAVSSVVDLGRVFKACGVTHRWRVGEWGSCLDERGGKLRKCGKGKKSRGVECVRGLKRGGSVVVVADEFCGKGVGRSGGGGKRGGRKPRGSRDCSKVCGNGGGLGNSKNGFKWVVGGWSNCSRPCGGYGLHSRTVSCHRSNQYDWVDPDALPHPPTPSNSTNYCASPKPKEYEYCLVRESCEAVEVQNATTIPLLAPYEWATSEYLDCACQANVTSPHVSFQKRRVYCSKLGVKVPVRYCGDMVKPKRKRKCECNVYGSCKEVRDALLVSSGVVGVADGEYLIKVGGKVGVRVYCYGMTGGASDTPVEYVSLSGDEDSNFSEVYDKRLIRPESCPRNGSRVGSCECVKDRNRRVGVTRWWKIRVNVSSLVVDVRDFRFSTSPNDKIPYGTAGDCYSSALNCSQGRFSIDLRGTGFAVSKLTSWGTTGHKASMRISRKGGGGSGVVQVVSGKCGGYCGSCGVVGKGVGFKLDVL